MSAVPIAFGPLRKPDDYPPQEPVPERPRQYREEAARRGIGVEGAEVIIGDDIYQRVALFRPARPSGTLFAFMHGGGWTSGCKETMAFHAPGLVRDGITFASIGYRLAPRHVFPAGLQDAAHAIQWLHRHAAALDLDPARIFVGGHSSGGHYAALLAVRHDWQSGLGLPRDVIRGCVAASGVFDLTSESGLTVRPRFLGEPNEATDREASPLARIDGHPPPFLIIHGDRDFPHLMVQAERMEAALRAAGGDVERVVVTGDHFDSSLACGDPTSAQPRILDWIANH